MNNTLESTRKVTPKNTARAAEVAEVEVIGKTYTYEEAIDEVLRVYDELGNMPKEDDYALRGIDTNVLLAALDVKGDGIQETVIKNHSKPYAGVNIITLRELRRRKGEKVYIAITKENGNSWKEFATNSNNDLFPV